MTTDAEEQQLVRNFLIELRETYVRYDEQVDLAKHLQRVSIEFTAAGVADVAVDTRSSQRDIESLQDAIGGVE